MRGWPLPKAQCRPTVAAIMEHKPIIENMVESIKGYFSISGLMVVGVYLINNAAAAPFNLPAINYVSGAIAILVGAVVGIWYSLHIFHKLIRERRSGLLTRIESIAYGIFVALATVVIATIVFGSVTQSCGKVF
jgi:hypothetical protein